MSAKLPAKRKFQAVIFDLDGTLFNSLVDLSESMNAVLSGQGFPTHPTDSYRYFVGDGMEKLVIRALPEKSRNNRAIVAQSLERMRTLYSQRWDRCSTLYPGIPALLDGLIARNLSLAIFSNKPQKLTAVVQEKYLADWPIHPVLGASSEYPLKPDPAGALAISRELSLSPVEILYLGDTAVDMLTARAAGMYAIGCLWGFREKRELKGAGAQLLLNHPQELLEWWDSRLYFNDSGR
jgi:phosphoglycolate phosphatase